MSFSAQSLGFQFTPLREGRPALNYTAEPFQQISIHAPPRGATRPSFAFRPSAVYFNSRPSARGDFCSSGRTWVSAISIHAPPRGATRGVRNSLGDKIFQFTPLREGRRLRFLHAPHSLLFQFTPLREGRPGSSTVSPAADIFQFTPLREGRPSPVALQTA